MSALPAALPRRIHPMNGCTPPRRFDVHDVRADLSLVSLLLRDDPSPAEAPLPVPQVREVAADGPAPAPHTTGERPRHGPVAIPFPDPEALARERAERQREERRTQGRTIAAVYEAVDKERRRHREALESAKVTWHEAGERLGYTAGLRYGVLVGVVIGALLTIGLGAAYVSFGVQQTLRAGGYL